ncbi:MAG TPA: antitoxin Xre/MbcA/ParS toxin-binding domain-containing protein [Kofleriaceae bacterium]|nr:antitoxin Xre/MbcA/ParS toxin-binding domain-containing protein [Kofleriaceae bacterium]
MIQSHAISDPDPDEVLTHALLRAASLLGVAQKDLAPILGVSAASVSRLGHARTIAPATKEGELALLFLRVFRSLDALCGGDEQAARAWLFATNHHLGGVPVKLMGKVTGLTHVAEYLDAMRGTL